MRRVIWCAYLNVMILRPGCTSRLLAHKLGHSYVQCENVAHGTHMMYQKAKCSPLRVCLDTGARRSSCSHIVMCYRVLCNASIPSLWIARVGETAATDWFLGASSDGISISVLHEEMPEEREPLGNELLISSVWRSPSPALPPSCCLAREE